MNNTVQMDSKKFVGFIKIDSKVNAPTVIYAMTEGKGEPWYSHGLNTKIFSGDKDITNEAKFTQTHPNYISFQLDKSDLIKIEITPK